MSLRIFLWCLRGCSPWITNFYCPCSAALPPAPWHDVTDDVRPLIRIIRRMKNFSSLISWNNKFRPEFPLDFLSAPPASRAFPFTHSSQIGKNFAVIVFEAEFLSTKERAHCENWRNYSAGQQRQELFDRHEEKKSGKNRKVAEISSGKVSASWTFNLQLDSTPKNFFSLFILLILIATRIFRGFLLPSWLLLHISVVSSHFFEFLREPHQIRDCAWRKYLKWTEFNFGFYEGNSKRKRMVAYLCTTKRQKEKWKAGKAKIWKSQNVGDFYTQHIRRALHLQGINPNCGILW